jgi:hypothetical protein
MWVEPALPRALARQRSNVSNGGSVRERHRRPSTIGTSIDRHEVQGMVVVRLL